MPYKWGGGHAKFLDGGYDCSGTVSYVLREAGIHSGCLSSKEYFNYGDPGPGKWITIYVRRGHVFMTIAGLRLDTGGSGERSGPRWKPQPRHAEGYVMRHPVGY
ncbi:MAG: NlpC/P60 family protein [Verrucomicrobiota bacterium]